MMDTMNDQNGMGGGNSMAATAAPGQQHGHPISTFEALCQLIQCDPTGMESLVNSYLDMVGGALTTTVILPLTTTNGGAVIGTPAALWTATAMAVAGASQGDTPATLRQGVSFLDQPQTTQLQAWLV